MKVQTSTDMARMLMLQRQATQVKTGLDRAALEMATGRKADQLKASGGNLAQLYAIDRMLERNAVHQNTIVMTRQRLEVMQVGLDRARSAAETLGRELTVSTGSGDMRAARIQAEGARLAFADMVGILNSRVGGQSLFAGAATDQPALAAADAILADIEAAVTGAASADEAVARVAAFFATDPEPGGFFTAGHYRGEAKLASAEVGDGVRIGYGLTAVEPELLGMLKGLATAALVGGGSYRDAPAETQRTILAAAGKALLQAQDGIIALQARTGAAQGALESAQAQRTAEKESFELTRTRLVSADLFETASMLQALQTQLEGIYTVTARLASLRFQNFMR